VRIRVLSDLHIEFEPYKPASVDCDLVVLAGDIGLGTRGLEWIRVTFQNIPAIYITGNHEFYGEALPHLTKKLGQSSQGSEVRFLECDATTVNGVRFVGCTLWSDFNLAGNSSASMLAAQEMMNDYRRIRVSPQYRKLRPEDTRLLHVASLNWLRDTVKSSTEPTVVVTHHAPSVRSLGPDAENDPLSPAFASGLDAWIETSNIVLWIHGHTHRCVDYSIGRTRILSNQRGYPDEHVAGFSSDLVVNL
jgi:predicted phosphodiesterase